MKAGSAEPLRLLLIAEESAGIHALRAAMQTGAQIAAVMTSDLGENGSKLALGAVARAQNCAVWPAVSARDPALAKTVRDAGIDLLLNVHSLHILPPELLEAPRIGAFNMHPGPLPEYGGLNAVSWAIYHGAASYGVTVHWMTPRVDAGDIAFQERFPIQDNDTPVSLTHKCVRTGVQLLASLIRAAAADPGSIPRIPQDLSGRRYYRAGDIPGPLCWTMPARDIVNFVRACNYAPYRSPWGRPTLLWRGREVVLLDVGRTHTRCDAEPGSIGQTQPDGAWVAAGDEWVLVRKAEIDGQPAPLRQI